METDASHVDVSEPEGGGMSEQDLIQAARRGDAEAIRVLYDRHAAQVYAVARRLTGDEALAEDCAQDAWMRALRHR